MAKFLQTKFRTCIIICLGLLSAVGLKAQFTPNNIAVLVAATSSSNTTASIVELNTTTASQPAVSTIPIPGTGTDALRFSSSATSTGYLSLSDDGSLLCFNGANNTNTAANVNTLNPRGIGTLNAAAGFSIATTYTGGSGNQTRSSTSLNNAAFFIADQGGLYTNGTSSASPSGNFRGIKPFGGTVYVAQSSSTATVIQLATVSATTGATITGLPGLTNNSSLQDFYLVSSGSNGTSYDVLYVLSATSNTVGSIAKYSLVSGSWVANGSYPTTFGGFGLAAQKQGGGAYLYVSTGLGAQTANSVLKLNDVAGWNAAISITTASNVSLYTSATGTIIKGVSFVPVAPAIPSVNLSVSTNTGSEAAATSITVTATASAPVAGNQTVSLGVSGTNITAGDYNLSNTTITILSGATTGTVTFDVVDDAVPEATETATLTISNPSAGISLGGTVSQDITIIDNDNTPPQISLDYTTTTNYIDGGVSAAPVSPFAVSGVINDPTSPAQTLGINFTISDAETAVSALTVTATSGNTTVVPNANLVLTGSDGSRNLLITPAAAGYSNISITVSDGISTATYTINYAASAASGVPASTRFHTGTSVASTAQAVDNNLMLVGDDENQLLRLYNRQNSGLPVNGFDFSNMLNLPDSSGGIAREVDIEASTRVGNRIFWMGSHTNASNGNTRPNRSRIFATDISGTGAATTLSYVGRYDGLKTDLINWDVTNGHGLGANYFGFAAGSAPGVAPEVADGSGFNIEGLTMAPNGTTGYISFRAPIVPASARTKALIVPVTNFTNLVNGNPTTSPALFAAPIQLDLGGRGIREIKRNGSGQYLIIAGPHDGSTGVAPKDFRLYTWSGNAGDAPLLRGADLTALNVGGSFESIVDLPDPLTDASTIQFLIDNGDAIFYNDGTNAKDLSQNNLKKFRSDSVVLGTNVLLPLGLLTASVQAQGTNAVVKWSTANGADYSIFEIEAGVNAQDFTSITKIQSQPGSGQKNYTITHSNAAAWGNKIYYRVKMISPSGNITYSNIMLVRFNGLFVSVTDIFPNPTSGIFNLVTSGIANEAIQIRMTDMNGKEIKKLQILNNGNTVLDISMNGKGVYVLEAILPGGNSQQFKIVKQ
ncbi:MAG: T9SS type A sorting domain-containing protein [Chitinophagaceae bacterium]